MTENTIKILAVSDVHSPRYLRQYIAGLAKHSDHCREVNLIIWAGDMIDKGKVSELKLVEDATRSKCGAKTIVAVYGNEEYIGLEEKIKKATKNVYWLNDEIMILSIKSIKIAIVGSRGVLDRPTRWQRKHIPEIWHIYRKRLEIIKSLIARARHEADKVILVTHYAPTYETLEGEPVYAWPEMGSKKLEKIIRTIEPDIAIHGHAHNSKKLEVVIDRVVVYNVAFPARNNITFINL